MNRICRLFCLCLPAILAGAVFTATLASVSARIGPYRLQIYTEPTVIPVGKARVRIDVTDASGKPVEGAEIRSLVQMPTMNMGEQETAAQPVPGQPGSYTVDASFGMAGRFDASLSIRGPLGNANGKVSLETGQDTGGPGGAAGGFSFGTLVPWLLGAIAILAIVFVVYRVQRTGQRLSLQTLRSREVIGGILLLVVAFVASQWAISRWKNQGLDAAAAAWQPGAALAPVYGSFHDMFRPD